MKKVICVLLTLALLIPNFVSVNAADHSQNEKVTTVTDSMYGFTYTEYVDENNQTIRTYKKQQSSTRSSADSSGLARAGELSLEATKVLLAALGMEDRFINKLSDQALQEYAECEEIYAVSSYTKTDADGKVTNVSKEEAMNAANLRAAVPAPDPGGGSYPSYEGTFSDSYMYISYVVSYRGAGCYRYSIDAIWLTMPVFRGYDSLGACSQNMTVENYTRNGWRSYTQIASVNGDVEYHDYVEYTQSGYSDFYYENATNGNWYGSAVVFDLPIDVSGDNANWLINRDYCVHFEFIGEVSQPDQQMNFNTVGSYCHTRVVLSPTFTIGIATSGLSVSIGINTIVAKDIRTAELNSSISYIP